MHLAPAVLLLLLLISIRAGIPVIFRPVTLQQYAVGAKGFSTANLVKALLVITYGIGIFWCQLEKWFVPVYTGLAISYFIIGNVLSSRFQFFLNNCSLAEIMGKLYGALTRKIVALCGLAHSIAIISISLKTLTKLISVFAGISESYSLFIALLFILLNSESSGMRVSTTWEVIRCATFSLLLPIIALVLWKQLANQYNNEPYRLILVMQKEWNNIIISSLRASPWQCISLFIAYVFPSLYPSQVQRILIAESSTQIKRSCNAVGCLLLSINVFLLFIVLLLSIIYKKTDLLTLPLEILDTYLGLKELFIIGMTALATASAGANLHISTVLLVNDLKISIGNSGKKAVMHFVPYTITVGIVAALLAYYGKTSILLFLFILFKATVSIPLCFSLMGIYLHPYAVITSIGTGIISTIGSQWLLASGLSKMNYIYMCFTKVLCSAMLIHLLTLTIAQFFFQKYKQLDRSNTYSKILTLDGTTDILSSWKSKIISILRQSMKCNFWEQLQKQLPKDNLPYLFFSFYIVVTGYGFFYTFANNTLWSNKLESMVLFPSLFVSTFFLIYISIPPNVFFKKIAAVLWPLSNGYFLFVVGNCVLILSKFAYLPAVILMFNIYLSILITSLPVIVISCSITTILLWLLPSYVNFPVVCIEHFWNPNSKIVYVLLVLLILIGTLFYHKKCLRKLVFTIQELSNGQEVQNARQFFNKQHIEALAYESSYIITELHQQLLRLVKPEETTLAHSIKQQTARLNHYLDAVFTHLKHNFYLTTNWISMDQLLEECFDKIKINSVYHAPYVVLNTEHLYIQCDIERIKQLITSSIHSCMSHASLHKGKEKDTFIYINDTQLGYQLTLLQGKIQKINALSFIITTDTQRPAMLPIYKAVEMADIQLLNNEKDKIYTTNKYIINTHYGYCEITHSNSDITHVYIIPVNIQDITKAFATLSPVVYTQRLDPVSRDDEAAFIKKLRSNPKIDIQEVMAALQLIKTYYATQKRKTGEPFYLHSVAVATILSDLTEERPIIMAGLLHDVVQNTPLTEAGLTTLVGKTITQIISKANRIDKELITHKNNYVAYIQYLVNTAYHTYHPALLVKLADVLHNAQTIHGHDIEKQIEKAYLIKQFYAPLAQQIGLMHIAEALNRYAIKVI